MLPFGPMQLIIIIVSVVIIAGILYAVFRKRQPLVQPGLQTEKQLLQQHVLFYQGLSAEEKARFEEGLRKFLEKVHITGIKTTVEDLDSVFVAAAAIIPIFAFKDWEYQNIHEVLLYPGSFNEDFQLTGDGRTTIGMVGNGPMQNTMILSQQDLRNGFLNQSDKSNTAIHEFVHLVDEADGDTDGLPEALLQHPYVLPWLQHIHQEIEQIKAGKSDINPYGAISEAEFLAVAAEYFFERPQLMEEKHPALFGMLQKIFKPS